MIARSLHLTLESIQKLRLQANIVICTNMLFLRVQYDDSIIVFDPGTDTEAETSGKYCDRQDYYTLYTLFLSLESLRPLTWIYKSVLHHHDSLSSSHFNPQSFETHPPFVFQSSSCSRTPNVLLQPFTSSPTSTPFVMLGSTVTCAVAALACLAPLVASMPAPMPADGAVKMIAARDPQGSVFVDPNAVNTNVQVPAGSSLPFPGSQFPITTAEVQQVCQTTQCADKNEYCYKREQLENAGSIGPDTQNCPFNQPAYAPPSRVPFPGGVGAPQDIDLPSICPIPPNTFAQFQCASKEQYCNALLQRNLVDTGNCNSQPAGLTAP